jgi:hypothetical protein
MEATLVVEGITIEVIPERLCNFVYEKLCLIEQSCIGNGSEGRLQTRMLWMQLSHVYGRQPWYKQVYHMVHRKMQQNSVECIRESVRCNGTPLNVFVSMKYSPTLEWWVSSLEERRMALLLQIIHPSELDEAYYDLDENKERKKYLLPGTPCTGCWWSCNKRSHNTHVDRDAYGVAFVFSTGDYTGGERTSIHPSKPDIMTRSEQEWTLQLP